MKMNWKEGTTTAAGKSKLRIWMKNSINIFILLLLLVLLASCGTGKELVEVPVVVEKPVIHEVYKTNTVRDTVREKDSVYIVTRGDTVYNNTVREFHHYTHSTDTVHSNDTITSIIEVPTTVIQEVEKPLTTWQKARMKAGEFSLLLLIAAVGFGGWRIIRKYKLL